MSTTFQSQGTFRFSPPLNKKGDITRRDGQTTQWWLILECDREIGRYFRHLYELKHHHTKQLQEPLWGSHISVIRGEVPPNLAEWKSLDGQKVTFEYGFEIEFYQQFAVVSAQCNQALDYREALGLEREPSYPLHLTIGNVAKG